MTITVIEDIIIGASFGLTSNGAVATRVFKATTTSQESMAAVLQHADIPQLYAAHPDTGGSAEFAVIFALDIDCRPDADDNAIYVITVQYARPDVSSKQPSEAEADCIIQVGSSVTATKTAQDKDGNRITVTLDGVDQVGEVDIQVPETIVIFERKEGASPRNKSVTYVGKVNSTTLGSGTYAVRTLLCLGIEGITQDDGETWQVTYRFQYRPDTWRATVYFIDPETDRPADGINIGTGDGVETVDVYEEANFSSLNLPW